LIRLLLAQPSDNDCVACVPCVEDIESYWWLVSLTVKELLLVCEGVLAELQAIPLAMYFPMLYE
jgi:hypothetical protein